MKKRLFSLAIMIVMLSMLLPVVHANAPMYDQEVYEHNLRVFTANNRSEEGMLRVCLTADSWIDSNHEDIIAKAMEITEGITDPFDKAKAIHDWMCENVVYYTERPYYLDPREQLLTASYVLAQMKGDDQGWTYLEIALLRASGVPARRVFGKELNADESDGIVWCIAFINNEWISIMSFKDTGNIGQIDGTNDTIVYEGKTSDMHFDISLEELSLYYRISSYNPSFVRIIEDAVLIKCGDDGSGLEGITEIAKYAFADNYVVTELIIPNGVTKVGYGAFMACRYLTQVTFPDSVVEFGESVLEGAIRLESVTMSQNITEIGTESFASCWALKEIVIPNGVKTIGRRAFGRCWALRSVEIPYSVNSIGWRAFNDCPSLKEVFVPPSVRRIDSGAFGVMESGDKVPGFVMYGAAGTAAEAYAIANDLDFQVLTRNAVPTSATIMVDGVMVEFDAYIIDNNNYFKLRDLAYALNGTDKQFNIEFRRSSNAINIYSDRVYTVVGGEMQNRGINNIVAYLSGATINHNNASFSFPSYNINNNNYYRLRDIAQLIDFNVTWDETNNTINVATSTGYAVR
ncbi:MAG: leucine-rich repeat protein [Oscillospiraceae bacterium]|nr:leucine-rich repeat protein [Oscillospiraceae bacterium]